ncbi:MAG: hypothetical protein KTR25_11930 [Myxococcales bacterium]|nr:hypothetical protein [Myxococcales bacterium]
MGWVIREVSFPWNALDEEGAYRAYATDERRSRSRPSPEKGPAKRLTHFSDGLLGPIFTVVCVRSAMRARFGRISRNLRYPHHFLGALGWARARL